jgi:hypothetical protein
LLDRQYGRRLLGNIARAIEEASRQFDLSPLDEAFLLERFRDSGRVGPVR